MQFSENGIKKCVAPQFKPAVDKINILFSVRHKALVKVNEAGVTFAAGSVSSGSFTASFFEFSQEKIIVNKPFLFFVEDVRTKTIIFLGRVMDPR